MNLSSKQLCALVKELQPIIVAKQREQLEWLKETLKDNCIVKAKSLNLPFNSISWLVKWLDIDSKELLKQLWLKEDYASRKTFSSEDELANFIFNKSLSSEFEKNFWKEIKAEDIEHELLLWTIWSANVEELLNVVKKKLIW